MKLYIVSAALLALWKTVCVEGSQSAEYAIDMNTSFKEVGLRFFFFLT